MKLWTEMADRFRAAGLTVQEYDEWKTRGDAFQPFAVMAHHTAPPVPFPLANLAGVTSGNIKCNVNIKPDGTVWTVAAGRANYSAGTGDQRVLNEVSAGIPPVARAKDRGWTNQDAGGSRHFFGIEVDHPGDGSPIPSIQLSALHVVCAVLTDMIGHRDTNRVITHAEWTSRKIDPYWDNKLNTGPSIRQGALAALDLLLIPPPAKPPHIDDVPGWAKGAWEKAFVAGLVTENTLPGSDVPVERLFVFLERAGVI